MTIIIIIIKTNLGVKAWLTYELFYDLNFKGSIRDGQHYQA